MTPGPRTALGIDFGTSHTIAVVRRADGSVRPLLFDGAPLMPSAVCADTDGGLLVGRDAVHAGRRHPERFEPNPKRLIDRPSTLLGEREYPVPDLIAAVLDAVAEECRRVVGRPAQVTLTVPAEWGPSRRQVVEDAAARSGLGQVRLVPEPVAAATYYAEALKHRMAVGASIVVYDLGAGTFDASVVRRTAGGFATVALDGRGDLGGLDIDAALVDHLGATYGAREGWKRLTAPDTIEDRRHYRDFQDEVRVAKERLSRHQQSDIAIPLLDVEAHLTRGELEQIARPHIEQTIRVTEAVIRAAGLDAADSAGVFLVGGASRMPLVATMLHRALGLAPTVLDQPEVVVAEGSVLWAHAGPATVTFPLQRPAAPLTPAPSPAGPPHTSPAAFRPEPPTPQQVAPEHPPYTEPVAPRPLALVQESSPPQPAPARTLPPRMPTTPPAAEDDAEPRPPQTEAERAAAKRRGRRFLLWFLAVDVAIVLALIVVFNPPAFLAGKDDDTGEEETLTQAFEPDWDALGQFGTLANGIEGAFDGPVASLATVSTAAEDLLFAADFNGTVRAWSLEEGLLLDEFAFPQGIQGLYPTTDPSGTEILVLVDAAFDAHVWDEASQEFTAVGGPELPDMEDVEIGRVRTGVEDGAAVLAVMTETEYELYDLWSETSLGVRPRPEGLDWPNFAPVGDAVRIAGVGYSDPVEVFAADGEHLGTATDFGDWTTNDPPVGLSILTDGPDAYAMIYGESKSLHFWDLATLEPAFTTLSHKDEHDDFLNEIVQTQLGPSLMYLDAAGAVQVQGAESGEWAEISDASTGTVTGLEHATVDGHPIAVTADDRGDIQFWSLGQ
ncbi:Hsp70 family protein [Glycomyces paridis]|uniref:Hsp70 family protein n=1 Tax=Glycomyces paridis TaxID=2126555 RepID=UPI00195840F5|nr:Hsp70 family protein [Glycomyces paridis]